MLFLPGDRILYCPYRQTFATEPCEADVLSTGPLSASVRLYEPDEEPLELELGHEDLYLLSPARRPFLEDVERVVRRGFQLYAAPAMRRYWIDQHLRSSGDEDDAALTELLRRMKTVRAQAWADGEREFAGVRERLRSEITGPEVWRTHYREWLRDESGRRFREQLLRDFPPDDDEHFARLLDLASEMRERCEAAAERLGLDERDL